MYLFDVGLHKISLGALVLSLRIAGGRRHHCSGDDGQWPSRWSKAGIAFARRLRVHLNHVPMLSGTLVTVPVSCLSPEVRHRGIHAFDFPGDVDFPSALVDFAAVIFIPYLGYHLLPDYRMAVSSRHAYNDRRVPRIGVDCQRITCRWCAGGWHHPKRTTMLWHRPLPPFPGTGSMVRGASQDRPRSQPSSCSLPRLGRSGSCSNSSFRPPRVELIVDMKLAEGLVLSNNGRQAKVRGVSEWAKDLVENYASLCGQRIATLLLSVGHSVACSQPHAICDHHQVWPRGCCASA